MDQVVITPTTGYPLETGTKHHVPSKIERIVKEIFCFIAILILAKEYPNRIALGCILGTLFPSVTCQATTKFWNALFHSKTKENLKIGKIEKIFYRIQPALIMASIGYFARPVSFEILPVAVGARLAAIGFRTDFFVEQEIIENPDSPSPETSESV